MSAQASMPLQYKRLYKGLLDADGVFDSLETAQEYASSPIGCPGHVIGVLENDIRQSYIVEEDGSLSRIAKYSEIETYLIPCWGTIDNVSPPEDNVIRLVMKNGKSLTTKNGDSIVLKQM